MKNRKLINVICVLGGLFWIALIAIGIFAVALWLSDTDPIDSYNEVFQMQPADGWTTTLEKGTLNESADFELLNSNKESYFIALMYYKDDYEYDFEEFSEHCFDEIEELYDITIDKVNVLNSEQGKEWLYTDFKTTYDGAKLYMRNYIIETDHYYGEILTWSTASHEEDLKKVADKMVLSIQEKEA